ncbi:MAG TPA: ATP-binding protein [Thermoanaerobaculia bacterium]|nr:ATP-binding protein [Thermoanaerobaculia bacterium]
MASDRLGQTGPPPDKERLRAALSAPPARFRRTSELQPRSAGAKADDELRFALALRGRCDPKPLLPPDLDPVEQMRTLEAVAADSDVGAGPERSLWLLGDAVRSRVLRSRPPGEVADALEKAHSGSSDPVTSVLYELYAGPPVDLESLTSQHARTLLSAVAWTGDHAPFAVDEVEVRRRLLCLARDEDYERQTGGGVFGRGPDIARLFDFLTAPPQGGGAHLSRAHVWGGGGIGKSTLMAAVALRFLHEVPGTVLVHFDFDRGDLDPTRASTLDLELLRQAGSTDPDNDRSLKDLRERIREQIGDELAFGNVDNIARQGFALEALDSSSRSVLGGSLDWLETPLILLFDTFEQVEAGGPEYVQALSYWLNDLIYSSGAPEVRLVVAGRTDPAESELRYFPGDLAFEIPLQELERPGAYELLQSRKVPALLAAKIYEAFGGNPLVLRLAADLTVQLGPGEIEAVTQQVRSGDFPPQFVQALLYDRFLKHIENKDAQRYAHPGLLLPELTPQLIQNVLGPTHGEPDMPVSRAQEIFRELSRATWLVRVAPDGKTLTQRPDVRRLMLRLMVSDPRRADLIRSVRAAAIAWHAFQPGVEQHALRIYHQLMGVQSREELSAFEGEDFSEIGQSLRLRMEDFPETVRAYVHARLSARLGPEDALKSLPDVAWRRYMSGSGEQEGEGERLVEKTDPLIALDLWRRRPFGEPGQPPTFVIQAVTETASWLDETVDVGAVVSSLMDQQPSPEMIKRLYWITRLALISRAAPLSPPHSSLLRDTLESNKTVDRVVALSALASVAEALQPSRPIVPDRFLTGTRSLSSETRLYLVRARRFGTKFDWRPQLDAIVTLQADWSRRVADVPWQAIERVLDASDLLEKDQLQYAQAQIDSLHGKPLDSVSGALRELRVLQRKIRLRIRDGLFDNESQSAGVLLLRGTTPEFYRPVRQALREALTSEPLIEELAVRLRRHLTICPEDLEPAVFVQRAVRDPVTWFLSIAQFADRARVLGALLKVALDVSRHPKVRLLLLAWRAWDRALCGDISSDWGASGPPKS